MRRSFFVLMLVFGLLGPAGRAADIPLTVPQDRSVDPVVLIGSQFAGWSAGPEITVREPQVADDPADIQSDCADETMPDGTVNHSCANDSRLPRVQSALGIEGAAVSSLLGYRWTGSSWTQIPFQVDERFTRYLTNNASGFAFYSAADQHTTYAFDREGFRFVDSDPGSCTAKQRGTTARDPIVGLDDNDELAFMFADSGIQAPVTTALPPGIAEAREVVIADPGNPLAPRYAYVMRAASGGPVAAYDAGNGYVRYQRDEDAGMFVYSQSSYSGYGAAPKGPFCNPDGTPALNPDGSPKIGQRRPKDTAWIYTPRYKFRYEGRWLMTELHVRDPGTSSLPVELGVPGIVDPGGYGPDLIDRWKARAFAQDPGSETPCCGYEEEDTNWGGSSILMGERSGPVRTIRETWGADSSTNNARREVFYRDVVVWSDALRVHPIPPLDGIYVQWDFNAGVVDKYYNPTTVARSLADPATYPQEYADVDGVGDEVLGNVDDPCNSRYDARDTAIDEAVRTSYRDAGLCGATEYHQSVDIADPTFSHPNQLQWEQIGSPHGSLVMRWNFREITPGGIGHSVVTVPYYRDESCFDDGTGSSPGPKLRLRSGDEPATWTNALTGESGVRKCWEKGDPIDPAFVNAGPYGDKPGDERYYQGSTGTAGVHLMFVAESDNLSLTVPTTEIVTEQRIVVLEGDPGNVGERYGRANENPLISAVRPFV